MVGDLDGGKPYAAGSRGNSHRVARPNFGDVDKCSVSGQVLHPYRRRLLRSKSRGSLQQCKRRNDCALGVNATAVHRKCRHHANWLAHGKTCNSFAERLDDPRGLVAETCRQLRLLDISAGPKSSLRAVDSDRFDAQPHFARARLADLEESNRITSGPPNSWNRTTLVIIFR